MRKINHQINNQQISSQVRSAIDDNMIPLQELARQTVITMWQFNEAIRLKIFEDYFLRKSVQLIRTKLSSTIGKLKGIETLIESRILSIFRPLKIKEISDGIVENFIRDHSKKLGFEGSYLQNVSGGQLGRFLKIASDVLGSIYPPNQKIELLELHYENGVKALEKYLGIKFPYEKGMAKPLANLLIILPTLSAIVSELPVFLMFASLGYFIFDLPTKTALLVSAVLTTGFGIIENQHPDLVRVNHASILSKTLLDYFTASKSTEQKPRISKPKSTRNIKDEKEPVYFSKNDNKDDYFIDYKHCDFQEPPSVQIKTLREIVKNTAQETIAWKVNNSLSSDESTIIELWTLTEGILHLNEKYYVLWDFAAIYQIIKNLDKKTQEKIIDKGILGKIGNSKGDQGWINCTKEMKHHKNDNNNNLKPDALDNSTAFKLKILGSKGKGRIRLFFSLVEISKPDSKGNPIEKKFLLGNPELDTKHYRK